MIKNVCDEGVINLATALIKQAVEEYQAHIDVCNDIQARACADMDSRGLVGTILAYATGDRNFLVKEVEKKISSQLEGRDYGR